MFSSFANPAAVNKGVFTYQTMTLHCALMKYTALPGLCIEDLVVSVWFS